MKGQKGITLVALVITIIVMLILAGVTISIAVNGGLFTQANNAATGTNNAAGDDAITSATASVLGEWYDVKATTVKTIPGAVTAFVNEFTGNTSVSAAPVGTPTTTSGTVKVTVGATGMSKDVTFTVDATTNALSITPATTVWAK